MEDLLIKTLEQFDYPIIRQGSLSESESYPENFFTFKNIDTYGEGFYDNKERQTIWSFIIAFYSSDPNLVNAKLLEAKKRLEKNGFIINGKGHDVESDEITHTGRGINVLIIENEEE